MTVPDVRGMDVNGASRMMFVAGLAGKISFSSPGEGTEHGRVVSQDAEPGYKLPGGSAVRITVAWEGDPPA